MSCRNSFLLACLALALALGRPSAARADWRGFLQLDGIPGDSVVSHHEGWIEVFGADVIAAQPGTLQGLAMIKNVDRASPLLALHCAAGTKVNWAILDLSTFQGASGERRILRVALTNVFLRRVQSGAAGDALLEEFSVTPETYAWYYSDFNPVGKLLGYTWSAWDVIQGIGSTNGAAPFASAGIRNTNGLAVRWDAQAGWQYSVYGVTSLNQPFVKINDLSPQSNGPAAFAAATNATSMFYFIQQVPPGFSPP